MTLDERLENVAVLGAAGKMGSGIVLLVAQEMAKLKIRHPEKEYHLYALDLSEGALDGLIRYIRVQAVKAAEKGCVMLRDLYAGREDLVENYDIIDAFTNDVMCVIRPVTDLSSLKDARMVFEAIVEDVGIKEKVLKTVDGLCGPDAFYFSNTSSIPIGEIDERVGLEGRIIGFHFYNPPAVQKLAELIPSKHTKKEVIDLSHEIANRLRKKIIPSNDIAGFIGNGHFMRDILHASAEVDRLSGEFSTVEATYAMNKVSQDFLIRPMGIFQLIDYVGVEVCQWIMNVMTEYIPGATLKSDLVDRMVEKKIIGGQNADGSQKDGFLKYVKNRPSGVYDLEKDEYCMFDSEGWTKAVEEKLGPLPDGWTDWRSLLMDPGKEEKLAETFTNLKRMNTLGAKLAKAYFKQFKAIGEGLVKDGVANTADDVNGVLMSGFYHLYGPINEYMD